MTFCDIISIIYQLFRNDLRLLVKLYKLSGQVYSKLLNYSKYKKDGKIIVEDRSDIVMMHVRGIPLDVLIVIGGDGSLKIAQRFYE